jgi:chromosome segregation protein
VEATLTQKPRERLEQLEEAAGVSRYKVRKRETLLHLHEVNSNVARLGDLQGETGRQMEELSQQAEQERQYLSWQQERQRWQTQIQHTAFRNAQNELITLQQQRDTLVINLAELAAELAASDSQLQTVRELAETVQEATARTETQWRHWDKEATQLEQNEAVVLSQVQGLVGEKERLGSELQEIEGQADRLQQEALQLVDPLNHQSDECQNQLAILERQMATMEYQVREIVEELDQKRLITAQHDADLGLIKQSLARWQGVLGIDSLDNLSAVVESKRAQVRQMEREVQQLSQELQQITENRQHLEHFRHHTEQELLPLRHQLAQRQARLRALHQLEAEGEGLPAGVRAILQAQRDQKLKGILGTVGSLLISDPDVALAIQIALGSASADVIVEHEFQARSAVKFLQAQALGRATFLPLDTIRPGMVPDGERTLNRLPGVVGWALDVVHYEKSLRPAISHLLGRVLVLKTLDAAMTVGGQHRFRYKMVTLDGQLVHAGGAITGGHHGQRDSRSSRHTEIQTLTRRVGEDVKIIEGKEELLQSSGSEIRETEILLDGVRERLSERRHQWTTLREALSQSSVLEQDPQNLVVSAQQLEEEIGQQRGAIEALQARELDMRQRLAAAAQRQVQLREALARSQAAHSQAEALRERLGYEQERVESNRLRIEKSLQQVITALEAANRENLLITAQRQAAVSHCEQERLNFEKKRRKWDELKHDALALENRLRALQHEDRRLTAKAQQLEQAIFKVEHAWADFVEDPAIPSLERNQVTHAQAEIVRLDQVIASLGDIMPGSLALYEQLKTRWEYLAQQLEDVSLAREDLLKTLDELDQEVSRRIEVAASRVEQSFSTACHILFSGGQGGLSWTHGDDGGVDVWVRPAGKRPSQLGLLSGGEKALGGIAWLFSLLSVRPSPFILLDEVEASLDEANAARFAAYLAELGEHTQCVIVTHHKSTMEIADALWGVAGDGQGQSRMVSVLLEQVSS